MKKQGTLTTILVILIFIAGGGGFYGGMTYQKSQTSSADSRFAAWQGQGGQGGQNGARRFFGQGQGRPVSGNVISQDANSVTIKMVDGSTKIVMLSGSTSISKFASGTKTDLKTGERVMAFGKDNSDGSVTATMIQIGGPRRDGQPGVRQGQGSQTGGQGQSQ